ncbi:hypothetical protein V8J36_17095 [Frigidibacter sp. MR17.14]|uniref:hypothetical protein n=1 Tax=Frigidibacter sp. MR17.14 TaxID=3126509 RepID=UPI0030130859
MTGHAGDLTPAQLFLGGTLIGRLDTKTFPWIAVFFSNRLGIAFGTRLTINAGLGYPQSAAVTAAVMGPVVLADQPCWPSVLGGFNLKPTPWCDLRQPLTKPLDYGGLDLPRGRPPMVPLALRGLALGLSSCGPKPSVFFAGEPA